MLFRSTPLLPFSAAGIWGKLRERSTEMVKHSHLRNADEPGNPARLSPGVCPLPPLGLDICLLSASPPHSWFPRMLHSQLVPICTPLASTSHLPIFQAPGTSCPSACDLSSFFLFTCFFFQLSKRPQLSTVSGLDKGVVLPGKEWDREKG